MVTGPEPVKKCKCYGSQVTGGVHHDTDCPNFDKGYPPEGMKK